MDIKIRIEGGIGDHLLSNRFVHSIRELYPDSNLLIYSDTDCNPVQLNLLKTYWPTLYKNSSLAPKRLSKTFKILSQFGEEIYNAAIENQDMSTYEGADKFYDLCMDRLAWTDYDFDWVRYFYYFPKPEVKPTGSEDGGFILANLFSRKDSPYSLDVSYVENLLKELSKLSRVIVVTTEKNLEFYNFQKIPNVEIRVADLNEAFYLSSKCSLFIGIDSGIRCMPYYFGKPAFYFSTFCPEYGRVLPSHLLRWVIFEKNVFPMNWSIDNVKYVINTAVRRKEAAVLPYLDASRFDESIVKRIYTKL